MPPSVTGNPSQLRCARCRQCEKPAIAGGPASARDQPAWSPL